MMIASQGPKALPAITLVSMLFLSRLHTLDFSIGGNLVSVSSKTNPVLSSSIDNIMFVNIRKSGGTEIKSGFQCFNKQPRKILNSTLANKIKACIHTRVDTTLEGALIPTVDAFLYNLRHPLDRMLAWYFYEHPAFCISKQQTQKACQAAQDVARHKEGFASQFFVTCFPSPHNLSVAFTNRMSKKCNKLIHQVIGNKVKGCGFRETPFRYDIRYYTNKTIVQYPNKSVLVVRSQVIFEDLHDLELQLGGNGTFKIKETFHDKVLSDELTRHYGPLCWAMRKELYEYRRLLQLSVNLDPATKEATIASAANRCGFSSWNEMEQEFKTKRA